MIFEIEDPYFGCVLPTGDGGEVEGTVTDNSEVIAPDTELDPFNPELLFARDVKIQTQLGFIARLSELLKLASYEFKGAQTPNPDRKRVVKKIFIGGIATRAIARILPNSQAGQNRAFLRQVEAIWAEHTAPAQSKSIYYNNYVDFLRGLLGKEQRNIQTRKEELLSDLDTAYDEAYEIKELIDSDSRVINARQEYRDIVEQSRLLEKLLTKDYNTDALVSLSLPDSDGKEEVRIPRDFIKATLNRLIGDGNTEIPLTKATKESYFGKASVALLQAERKAYADIVDVGNIPTIQ